MANKMLIDATHPEETRVVVVRGNRVEEFDFESATRKQLRGNIYLAKVTRVEPSLQAAFVDYGGNRHGFLAFSEIHPDYYQIPVADRQALLDDEQRDQREQDDEDERRDRGGRGGGGNRGPRHRGAGRRRDPVRSKPADGDAAGGEQAAQDQSFVGETDGQQNGDAVPLEASDHHDDHHGHDPSDHDHSDHDHPDHDHSDHAHADDAHHHDAPADATRDDAPVASDAAPAEHAADGASETHATEAGAVTEGEAAQGDQPSTDGPQSDNLPPVENNIVEVSSTGPETEGEETVESVGGDDAMEELSARTHRPRRHQYKIQEVIKRRQVMLVQVVKEERGTKGAALTTYLSLAGRYSVLMPNTARGGGVSRKITDALDRRRLKEMASELDVPEGMGVILRTAGASRTKTEIKRDFEYLLRLWETVRDLTLKSSAPTLVYEEGSLVKRSIRDLYNKDIDEVVVAGDTAHKEAKDFMRMLMPSHAKNVKPYKDPQPLLVRYGVESQLDAMFSPTVQLKSGGYIVINQTEALVAIDVNSGRSTREHHIEDTALKTNMEAADEVARQLRLRDLAGLIVIDFIDMDEKRNNRTVERRMKDALKHDRARIQVGHISHFGLLEMSRQRIRSSVLESSTEKCPHCGGTGHVRSVSSVALQLLRAFEENLLKGATHNLIVRTRTDIAIYVLNHKRAHLRMLEERFQITISISADETVTGQQSYLLEKGEQVHSLEQARALVAQSPEPAIQEDDEDDLVEDEDDIDAEAETAADSESTEDASADSDSGSESESETAADANGGGTEEERNARRGRRRRRGRRSGGEPREARAPREGGNGVAEPAVQSEDISGLPPEAQDGDEDTEANDAEAGQPRGEVDRNGDPRKRRRGRRGGRRNRRGREGEGGEPTGEQPGEQALGFAADGELSETDPQTQVSMAATIGAYEPRGDVEQPTAPPPQELAAQTVPQASAQAAPPSGEAATPRRRSTVREPAPVFGSAASSQPAEIAPGIMQLPESEPTSAPAPVQPSDAPRKAGWWSRNLLGKS